MARNAHPEVTRQRILDAAKKLFAQKGYERTTIQDILDELEDLSKGAIYHHFKNKEAMLHALIDSDNGRLLPQANQEDGSRNGLQKLRNSLMMQIYRHFHNKHHIPGRGKKESFFGIPCQHQAGQM